MLTMHATTWISRCNENFDGPEQSKGIITSLHKQSLLMTVEQCYEKSDVLPVEYRKWLDLPLPKNESLHVKPLQSWIAQTKILFQSNQNNFNKENKITNYFRTGPKINDNNNNMTIPNTISETNILKQNNRNSSANKETETIITSNYNTIHPT